MTTLGRSQGDYEAGPGRLACGSAEGGLHSPTRGGRLAAVFGRTPLPTLGAVAASIDHSEPVRRAFLIAVALAALCAVAPAWAAAASSPTGLTGVALSGSVDLAWQPVSGVSAYNV